MKSTKLPFLLLGLALPALSWGQLNLIDNSLVTIADFSSQIGTFEVGNAIDTGAGSEFTDFSSNGDANNAYIDFDFGETITFGQITYVDRVTSGGAQGSFFGGTTDFVSGYDLIFSQNAIFGDGDDQTVSITGLTAPTLPTNPADFANTTPIASISARYVRWDVTASGPSPNTGASNFEFYEVVPEPAAGALLFGIVAALTSLRRRVS